MVVMNTRDIYVIDVIRSRYAVVEPLPINRVKVIDDFWGPRLETLVKVTLPLQFKKLRKRED